MITYNLWGSTGKYVFNDSGVLIFKLVRINEKPYYLVKKLLKIYAHIHNFILGINYIFYRRKYPKKNVGT